MRFKFVLIFVFFCFFSFDFFLKKNEAYAFSDSKKNFFLIELSFNIFVDTLSGENDSLPRTSQKKKNELDSPIFAESKDSIIFFAKEKKFLLKGSSKVKYKNISLESEIINVDFNNNIIEAKPEIIYIDSINKFENKGAPILKEGESVYYGDEIIFNFKTQKGSISNAKTKSDNANYFGEKIYKADRNVYFAKDVSFTTCNLDEPHFDFFAKDMKLIKDEQIIARWIWFRIAETPFPIPLPFAVFPNRSGRQSGFIVPAYGKNFQYGHYFSNFGYFWAINEYMDLTLTSTYYLKGGYSLNSRYRYVKRYEYSGNIEANYSDLKTGEKEDFNYSRSKDYRIAATHNQVLSPTSRLDANLNFQSGSYFRNNSYKYDELLKQDIISNASYSSTLQDIGASFSINYQRNQNLQTGIINETLPSINFSKSVFYPFRFSKVYNPKTAAFYENLSANYSANFRNDRSNHKGKFDNNYGFIHNLNFYQNQKFVFFVFSQSAIFNEKLYFSQIRKGFEISPSTLRDTFVVREIDKIGFVRTFNLSANASTKLYGIAKINNFGIDAFRHTFAPSIAIVYNPDFSEKFWGYYDEYYDLNGKKIKYDKFEKGIFGGAPKGRNLILNFSASNLFEVKTLIDDKDSLSQAKKIQLLNLNFSFNYNFAADSLRFSPINLNYRTQIGNYLALNGSSSFSLYEERNGVIYDNYYFDATGKLARLTFFSISVSSNLNDKLFQKVASEALSSRGSKEAEKDRNLIKTNYSFPWNASINYNYSISMPSSNRKYKSSNIYGSLETSISENWKISVSGSYDLIKKEISAPLIKIYRDLHCWELNFNWNPMGIYRGYRLEIRAKASQLQDLKITKSKDIYSR